MLPARVVGCAQARAVCLIVGFVLVFASGCAQGGEPSEADVSTFGGDPWTAPGSGGNGNEIDPGESPLVDSDVLYPTVEFFSGGMTEAERQSEIEQSVSSCMQQRGWSYEPVLPDESSPQPRTVGELRRFRETYGYGTYAGPELSHDPREAADRNAAYWLSLTSDEQDDYLRDLQGAVEVDEGSALPGSCQYVAGEAQRIPLHDQAVMKEMQALYEAAAMSPDLVLAWEAWSACMIGRGYDFRDATDAVDFVDTLGQSLTLEEAAAQEVGVATADFECRLITVMPVWHRLEVEVVRTLVERYPEWGE